MKRLIALIVPLALVCLLVAGCALFRGRGKEGSQKSANPAAEASAAAPFGTEGGSGTNQSTVTITSSGTITTTTSGGKVTTTANGGMGGAGSGLGGTETGTGNPAASGHGPLFYFYVLFAAAIVIWVVWAVWHSWHQRHQRRFRPRYRSRRRLA